MPSSKDRLHAALRDLAALLGEPVFDATFSAVGADPDVRPHWARAACTGALEAGGLVRVVVSARSGAALAQAVEELVAFQRQAELELKRPVGVLRRPPAPPPPAPSGPPAPLGQVP